MSGKDRMAVNAAVEQLVAGTDRWEEHARVIIEFCRNLRSSSIFSAEYLHHAQTGDDEITGHVPGIGNVSIRDQHKKEQKEYCFGIHKERVGYYKIWKELEGHLAFQHYWKSDLGTQTGESDEPEVYRICYDKTTFQPTFVAICRDKKVTLWFGLYLDLFIRYLEPRYGSIKGKWEAFDGFGFFLWWES